MEQVIAQLSQQRQNLVELDHFEDPGRVSAIVDVALISLYNRLTNPMDLDPQEIRRHGSIVALGEFGRRHLGPYSPVFVLFLQTPESPLDEELWVNGIVVPLREAGWDVDYRMATPPEAVELALTDHYWLGALIDSRFISGSRALMEDFHVGLMSELQGRPQWPSPGNLLREWQERQAAQRDPAYLLEPDLGLSAGSLGELCRIRWTAYLLMGKRSLAEMPSLVPDSIDALQQAERFLLRVRNQLQLLRSGRETRLLYEAQEEVAPRLGYQDKGDFLAVELMMTEVESHFYNVNLVAERCRDLLEEWIEGVDKEPEAGVRKLAPGIDEIQGSLVVDPEQLSGPAGKNLQEIFRQAVNRQLPLSLGAFQWAREQSHHLPAAFTDRSELREWLFDIFRKETQRLQTIRALYDTRVLQALIPELRSVHCLVQHDAFHLYPVHEHHLRTFAEIKRLLGGEYNELHPETEEWLQDIEEPEILLLAGLIHDVGKSEGRGHARRGGEMARSIGERLGLVAEETDLLSFLVDNHVLLTDSAARRDLFDEEMLQHCARVVGSRKLLNMLMVHSFADLMATGPRASEYWQSLPMLELYKSLHQRLEKGDPDEQTVAARLERLRGQVAASISEMSQEELEEHFQQLPHRYLIAVTPEEMVTHLQLERQLDGKPISWEVQRKQGHWQLTLMSRQPQGLLSRVAGILTLHRLDIKSAQTHTKTNGTTLQIFEVGTFRPKAEVSWDEVLADLHKSLQGKLALEYRLALHAAKQKRKKKRVPAKPHEVVVDNNSSRHYTIIEVYTTDRPGLLYSITRTLVDLHLRVLLAKISTRMDQVADVFYVRTYDDRRVEDPEQIEEIKRALLFNLG